MLLFTLAIGFVMAMIDVTAVNTALSHIAADLQVPLDGLVWVVDGYTLTFAALLLAGGGLADRLGPKQTYQGGLAVFVLGSALCALAPSGAALVWARLLQGCGAALFMPSSLALLTHAEDDERRRAKMFGVWAAIVSAAATIGPLAGGVLVETFGWRSIFWMNVPLGVLGIALAQARAPAPAPHDRPLGIVTHFYGVAALGALAFALIEGPVLGWTSLPVAAALAGAVLAAVLLVQRERASAQPVLPRALYALPPFRAGVLTGLAINFGSFGHLFVVSLLLQQAHGIGALGTGLAILPMTAAAGVSNVLSGRVIAARGARLPLLVGMGGRRARRFPADAGGGRHAAVARRCGRHPDVPRDRLRDSGDDVDGDAGRRQGPCERRRCCAERQPPGRRTAWRGRRGNRAACRRGVGTAPDDRLRGLRHRLCDCVAGRVPQRAAGACRRAGPRHRVIGQAGTFSRGACATRSSRRSSGSACRVRGRTHRSRRRASSCRPGSSTRTARRPGSGPP